MSNQTIPNKESLTTLIENYLQLWNGAYFGGEDNKRIEYENKIRELALQYKKVTGHYYFRQYQEVRK